MYTDSSGSWHESAQLSDPDGGSGDGFADAVALSGDGSTAVVGAEGDDTDTGAAFLFSSRGGPWTQTQKLVAASGQEGDIFGTSVAVSAHGGRVLVGAKGYDEYTGAGYVFGHGRAGLRQVATLLACDRSGYDMFGSSAALSANGRTAVVGADAYPSAQYDGAAYLDQTRPQGK